VRNPEADVIAGPPAPSAGTERRVYGDAVAHSLGVDEVPALKTRSLRTAQVGITRISCGLDQLGMTRTIPPEDTFIIALYLTDVAHHELWSHGKRVIAQGYAANSMRIVNLEREYSAYIAAPHETVCFYIPRAVLNEITDEAGDRRIPDLVCAPGEADAVVAHLGAAVLPCFERPAEASTLFIDQIASAICSHVAHRYGGLAPDGAGEPLGLSAAQERRALEFLSGRFAEDVSVTDVARECALSRGHFIRAFRLTTGLTPHKWLQQYRVQQAKRLLRGSPAAIAEVALLCGFADQSHLTRIFTRLVGISPAAWRKAQAVRSPIDLGAAICSGPHDPD